jgi:hypothetical protein
MKKILALVLVAFAITFSGCKNEKIEAAIQYVAKSAPEGEGNAITGYRTITIKNLGKWNISFIGLHRVGNKVYADSFVAEGMFTRYEGAPFVYEIDPSAL